MSGNLFAHPWSWLASCFGKPNRTDVPSSRGGPQGDRHESSVPLPPESPSPETEVIVDQLRAAMRHCNMGDDDPNSPLVIAFIHAIRHLGARTATSDRIAQESSNAVLGALRQAKKFTESEIERIRASSPTPGSYAFQQYAREMAKSAEAALVQRIRVFDYNTALLAVLILFGNSAAFYAIGRLQGGAAAYADMQGIQEGLIEFFGERFDETKATLPLLRWNSIIGALAECNLPGRTSRQDDRKFCDMRLWIEKAPPPVKRESELPLRDERSEVTKFFSHIFR